MDHAAVLREQNRLLADLTRAGDPSTPVPSCPDWTLATLQQHVGRGDRWAAAIVRDRADARVDQQTVPGAARPADPDEADAWLREGVQQLLAAVDATGADVPVWTFTGRQPAAWWIRRRVYESVVHRADAALALGVPFEVEPEIAADGVSEWLMLLAARRAADPPALGADETLHLHATDDGLGAAGEWLVRAVDGRVVWEHGHGKGAVAVRGAAADLLLAVLRRIPAEDERLQVLGDPAVLAGWLSRTGF